MAGRPGPDGRWMALSGDDGTAAMEHPNHHDSQPVADTAPPAKCKNSTPFYGKGCGQLEYEYGTLVLIHTCP